MSDKAKKPGSLKDIAAAMDTHQKSFGDIPCISIDDAKRILTSFLSLVFPHYLPDCDRGKKAIERQLVALQTDLVGVFGGATGWTKKTCEEKVVVFLNDLPEISKKIARDAESLVEPIQKIVEPHQSFIVTTPRHLMLGAHRAGQKVRMRDSNQGIEPTSFGLVMLLDH